MRPALALAALALLAGCADMRGSPQTASMVPVSSHETVELRGKITASMVEEARAALARGVRSFEIDSKGGLVIPAIALGGTLNGAGARLTVRYECWSACVHVLALVKDRHALPGADVRFHAISGGTAKSVAMIEGLVTELMVGGGFPRDLIATYGADINPRRLPDEALIRMGLRR